jgi:excinuclease UvrABC helicase subunit UvrB
MIQAAKLLDFEKAAQLRDHIYSIERSELEIGN